MLNWGIYSGEIQGKIAVLTKATCFLSTEWYVQVMPA